KPRNCTSAAVDDAMGRRCMQQLTLNCCCICMHTLPLLFLFLKGRKNRFAVEKRLASTIPFPDIHTQDAENIYISVSSHSPLLLFPMRLRAFLCERRPFLTIISTV